MPIQVNHSLYSKSVTALLYIIDIQSREITPGKAQIVDGIEQVGLTHPIITANAYHPFREGKGTVGIVLKLK